MLVCKEATLREYPFSLPPLLDLNNTNLKTPVNQAFFGTSDFM